MEKKNMSRRGFLGLTAAGAALGVAGLAGCSPAGSEDKPVAKGSDEGSSTYEPGEIAETIDADIVVVGLGMSGLAAAVQAANNGDRVVGIEATNTTGGNGIGVEGIFAVGTQLQEEAGIEVTPVEIIQTEMEEAQMVTNGALWNRFINASGDNVEWLIEQGVKFSGMVDDYLGSGIVSCFHWFEGDVASVGYVPHMTARAEELGVDVRLETSAKQLIMSDGKVAGLFAEDSDGNTLQINARAVILATGGFAQNQELMEERGWNWDNIVYGGTPGHNGDGLKMAFDVGARSFVNNSTFNSTNICGRGDTFAWKADTFTSVFCGAGMFGTGGAQLWVNEDGERFICEDFANDNFEMQCVPAMTHRAMYSVFDRAILEAGLAGDPDMLEFVDTDPEDDLCKADTVAELAEYFDVDAAALQASVDRYNELCEKGADADFGKPAEAMVPISTPPFYMAKLNQYFLMSVGGIECDINAQVVDQNKEPIAGLYAVGTDGCMLYRNIYTINVGGTCNGNNVNSGRTAANHAHEYLAS